MKHFYNYTDNSILPNYVKMESIQSARVNLIEDFMQEKVRSPCKCGYCGEVGHTVRSCKSEYVIKNLNEFRSRIRNVNFDVKAIIHWFMSRDDKDIKILCTRLFNFPYHKPICHEKIIEVLTNHINNVHSILHARIMINMISILDNFTYHTNSNEYFNIYPLHVNDFIIYNESVYNFVTDNDINIFDEVLHIENTSNRIEKRRIREDYLSSLNITTLYRIFDFLRYVFQMKKQFILNKRPVVKYTFCIFTKNENLVCPIESSIDCAVCMDIIEQHNISKLQCGHSFCTKCIETIIDKIGKYERCNCPMCRCPIDTIMKMEKEMEMEKDLELEKEN